MTEQKQSSPILNSTKEGKSFYYQNNMEILVKDKWDKEQKLLPSNRILANNERSYKIWNSMKEILFKVNELEE